MRHGSFILAAGHAKNIGKKGKNPAAPKARPRNPQQPRDCDQAEMVWDETRPMC